MFGKILEVHEYNIKVENEPIRLLIIILLLGLFIFNNLLVP